jgi:hypothetical protein
MLSVLYNAVGATNRRIISNRLISPHPMFCPTIFSQRTWFLAAFLSVVRVTQEWREKRFGFIWKKKTIEAKKYIQQHTIETGWTREFAALHPDLIEKFLQVRLSGMAPLENYLHFVVARQQHDHAHRVKRNVLFVSGALG